MKTQILNDFIVALGQSGAMNFADYHALRNDILDSEPLSQEDIEALLSIERLPIAKPEAWSIFLVDTVVDHLVWGQRPTGQITQTDADWILSHCAADGRHPTGTMRDILIALVREAQGCDKRLVAAAFGQDGVPMAMARVPMTRTLGWLDASGVGI
jgi:hypothetical protein